MNKPKQITINSINYYSVDDLHKYEPLFFKGISRNLRGIIKLKKLTNDKYIYAYIRNDKWIISNKSYVKAKLLLKETWVYDNIPKLINNQNDNNSHDDNNNNDKNDNNDNDNDDNVDNDKDDNEDDDDSGKRDSVENFKI